MQKKKIVNHRDLDVYNLSFDAAMAIFKLSKNFPKEERYALTDQIRRSSRSVSANLAEAWRKRRYEKAFISKLSDSEGEAAETQVWLEFDVECGYLDAKEARKLYSSYTNIIPSSVGFGGVVAKPLPSPPLIREGTVLSSTKIRFLPQAGGG